MTNKAKNRAGALPLLFGPTGWQREKRQEDGIESLKRTYRYVEVRSYDADLALSGDSGTEERSGLEAMLRDAEAGLFDVILVDSFDRFTRQDMINGMGLAARRAVNFAPGRFFVDRAVLRRGVAELLLETAGVER